MAGKFDSGKTNDDEIRIVMVGRTGIGKSATGNIILGRECFESKLSPVSMTVETSKGKAKVDGHRVAVIDTPGLFDTRVDEEETQKNICQCISYASPGPHIFLVVVRLGRYTEEEKHIVPKIQNIYGTDADKYSMVLFTHGDLLGGTTIEEFLEGSPDLQELVARCNGQYHVFNNKLKERSQVTELIQKIREIVQKNGGSHYTNEMFQKAERAIEEEKQRILREKEEEKEKMEREIRERYEKEMQKYNEQLQAERERERKERGEERKREREEREAERKREREEREWEMKKLKEKCEREIWERYEKEMQKYKEQLQAERERERKEREEERKREREEMNEERKREMEEREAERKREREEREWEMKKLKEKCERELKKERLKIQSRYENEARDEAEEFNPLFFLTVPAETVLNIGHAVVGGVKKLGKMLKTTFTF